MGGGERREVTHYLCGAALTGFALQVFAHAGALRMDAEGAVQEQAEDGVRA